jgi:TolA-binding protein
LGLWAEPSVYSNGGFSSASRVAKHNAQEIAILKQQISEQNQRIEGLLSVVEGLTASVNGSQASATHSSGIDIKILEDLGSMIDKINANYVTKSELLKALNAPKRYKATKTVTKKTKSNPKQTLSSSYSEGVRLFSKKRYSEAKKRFARTDEKGYKPAASNYYLGEIAYYTKQYEDAIFHFKKSAGLYDRATYIDILLLHTAISLERTGQKGQARAFYQNIIANYQGKKSASIAQTRLKKL